MRRTYFSKKNVRKKGSFFSDILNIFILLTSLIKRNIILTQILLLIKYRIIMEKKELFALLDRVLFSPEDAVEYFSRSGTPQVAIIPPQGGKIITSLPVVYMKNNIIEVRPYLDFARKKDVWGVYVGGVLWCKDQSIDTFENAKRCISKLKMGEWNAVLPSRDMMEALYHHREKFSETLRAFAQVGISYEWSNSYYWIDNYPDNAFDMEYMCLNAYSNPRITLNYRVALTR